MELKSVRKIIKLLRRIKFKNSAKYRSFLKDNNNKIIYLSETDHTNLGDHAILYAQHKLVDENTEAVKYSFTRRECLCGSDLIQKGVRRNDLILIPGGGWIGTLWERSGELFLTFLELFKNSRIVVFPQTIYFNNSEYGKTQAEKFYHAVEHCRDITLYMRDPISYQFMQERMPRQNERLKYALLPDMVLCLQPQIQSSPQNHALFVIREDREKITDSKLIELIKTNVAARGLEIKYSTTHTPHSVSLKHREKALFKKWKEFSAAKLVITDRLHGMLFAVINSTPCIAMDNLSSKVRGVYDEWLSEDPHVAFLTDNTITCENLSHIIDNLLNSDSKEYSNSKYEQYFNDMIAVVKKNEESINGSN